MVLLPLTTLSHVDQVAEFPCFGSNAGLHGNEWCRLTDVVRCDNDGGKVENIYDSLLSLISAMFFLDIFGSFIIILYSINVFFLEGIFSSLSGIDYANFSGQPHVRALCSWHM